MNLFYVPDISGERFVLDKDQSKHIVRVLRKVSGDTVFFTDGKGTIYTCTIEEANPSACSLVVLEQKPGTDHRDFKLSLAVAPTKNIARYEWFLEKATEIGVDQILPFFSEHSERTSIKPERLQRVIISAMKQSLKSHLPNLATTMSFVDLISMDYTGEKYIAHAASGEPHPLSKTYTPRKDVLILIGPEGDFSQGELDMAFEKGFIPVGLGPSRLRTETAAIVACHTINLMNGS